MWEFTNPDARPISEYIMNYHDARKTHRFLFYCRECIRNFDSTTRIKTCPKCNGSRIFELPKDPQIRKRHEKKRYGREDLQKDMLKARQNLAVLAAAARQALWKAKIALYYISTPVPEELR